MTFLGQLCGLVLVGGIGGVVVALIGGPSVGIFGVLLGLIVAYPTVKILMNEPALRPALKWLFPYEGWTGQP